LIFVYKCNNIRNNYCLRINQTMEVV